MPDARFFAKLDVGYFDNPKVSEFLEDRPRVTILHLRAITYCRQHLTDGVFPIRLVARLACATHCQGQCQGQCDFCAAVDAGLFVRIDDRNAEVHDYLKHQDSAEQVRARKSAGQKGAAGRWSKGARTDGNASRNARRNADGNADANAEERRGEESKTRADAIASDFDEWYSLYPRKRDRGHALKAYKAARKKVSHDTLMDALRAQREELTSKGVEFCAYPATWLNGERWMDQGDEDPTPLRPVHYRDFGEAGA